MDNFLLRLHQYVIDRSGRTQRWWAWVSLKTLAVTTFVLAAIDFDPFWSTFNVLGMTVGCLMLTPVINRCPEEGYSRSSLGPALRALTLIYAVFLGLAVAVLFLADVTGKQLGNIACDIACTSLFVFLRCGKPKPPRKRHSHVPSLST